MSDQYYDFGPYRLVPGSRELWRGTELVSLSGKEFDTLHALARRVGSPIDKNILLSEIWPDRQVDENNLTQQVRSLRRKLGKDEHGQDYIRTIPNQGYFIALTVANDSGSLVARRCLPSWFKSRLAVAIIGSITAFGLAIVFVQTWWWPRPSPVPPPKRLLSRNRFFWRSAAEGGRPIAVPLTEEPFNSDISSNGQRVYILARRKPVIMAVDTSRLTAHEIPVSSEPRCIRVSPDGRKIYLGLFTSGIVVLNAATERTDEVIATDGPVSDIEITPDGRRLYAAMMHRGVWRLTLDRREWKRLTFQGCPYFVTLNPAGTQLVVSYQCGGPTGRDGHDAIEIFDTATETAVVTFSGPPLVGGRHQFSPDGKLLWLDGWDACETKTYDHQGCPVVPSLIHHVFRIADRTIVKSLPLSSESGEYPTFLPDGTRVFMSAHIASVLETSTYDTLETYDLQDHAAGPGRISADGKRVYIAREKTRDLLVFTAEDESCLLNVTHPTHFFTGDGTVNDSLESPFLTPAPEFRPGFIGQAFAIDGSQNTKIHWSSDLQFGTPWSVAFYVKTASSSGPILEWYNPEINAGWYLGVNDNKLSFELQSQVGEPVRLTTERSLQGERWSQVVVTEDGRAVKLYIDGALASEAAHAAPLIAYATELHVGWSARKTDKWKGLIDELAFWMRTLPAQEVADIYKHRAQSPCRP
jgi:DNA-binding winged helix-turn-helix (wHTH) protein